MPPHRTRLMLPAYNEQRSLPALLARVAAMRTGMADPLDVLVVNDGSTDNTLAIVRGQMAAQPWLQVLDLQPNRGLAGAMREGLAHAIADLDDNDVLATMDADDSHDPALIPRMLEKMDDHDLVIASRYRKGSRIIGLAWHRQALSTVAGVLFQLFAPMRGVRDYTCGFRTYRVGLVRKALAHYGPRFIEQQGFACMGEILMKMRPFHPRIAEVGMVLRYDQKKDGSKMNVGSTTLQTLRLLMGTKK